MRADRSITAGGFLFMQRKSSLVGALALVFILQACGGGHGTMLPDAAVSPTASDSAPAAFNSNAVTPMSLTLGTTTYPTSTFMPSSTGKISSFQIFDETSNGTISSTSAATDGYRYAAVWGVRPGLGAAWRTSNAMLRSSYYFLMDTDMSTAAWGAIGHSLAWWQSNHPDWILYKCSSTTNAPTTLPAYDSGLPNVPLDIHNPAVVQYQIAQMAGPYALRYGYSALAADEATYWIPATGGAGYYGCGIYKNGVFVRRYSSENDPAWATDLVNWVKSARYILTNNATLAPYHLKFIINHPGGIMNTNEATIASNIDADMDETGFTSYGRYLTTTNVFVPREARWMQFMQAHGAAVLINQDWGSITVGAAQKDYSAATYLLGNEDAAAVFATPHTGYGVETYYHPEYAATNLGSPCAEFYGGASTAPGLYYRKFAYGLVVVNAGGYGTEKAALESGHVYTDLEGRSVTNPLSVAANDGYVLKTTHGCN
jgi:hypothetical protein